jgi:hypothetical protein
MNQICLTVLACAVVLLFGLAVVSVALARSATSPPAAAEDLRVVEVPRAPEVAPAVATRAASDGNPFVPQRWPYV